MKDGIKLSEVILDSLSALNQEVYNATVDYINDEKIFGTDIRLSFSALYQVYSNLSLPIYAHNLLGSRIFEFNLGHKNIAPRFGLTREPTVVGIRINWIM